MTETPSERQLRTWTRALLAAFVAAAVVFTAWPGIDLWASGLFYAPGRGFVLADAPVVRAARSAILAAIWAVPLAAASALLARPFGWRPWGVPARLWLFLLGLYLIGPGLLANTVLKDLWGRARPADVAEFGGAATFTPALRWANECATNCSFVSGEGAGATALAVALVALAPFALRRLPARRRRRVLGWALAVPAAGLVLRVAMGRHFLSDTVFAVLLVLAVAVPLWRLAAGGRTRPGGGG